MKAALKFFGVCLVSLAVVGCRHAANEASKQTQPVQILPIRPAITHNYSLEQKVTEAKLIVGAQMGNMYGSRLQNVEIKDQQFLWGKPLTTNAPILLVSTTEFFIPQWFQHKDARGIFFLSGDVSAATAVTSTL